MTFKIAYSLCTYVLEQLKVLVKPSSATKKDVPGFPKLGFDQKKPGLTFGFYRGEEEFHQKFLDLWA